MGMLLAESFAARMRLTVGAELNAIYADQEEEEWPPGWEIRIESLFRWISIDGGLNPEWLRTDKGIFLDDNGSVVPQNVKPSLSPVEQLAAFGLWFIEKDMPACGPDGEEDWDANRGNQQGISELDVANHTGECLLLAYQALTYAEELRHAEELRQLEPQPIASAEEQKGSFDFSKAGKKGSIARHAPMKALREFTLLEYRAGTWTTVTDAADALKERVIDYGRTIGADLKKTNATRKIKEWIYADNKEKNGAADEQAVPSNP